MLRPTQGGQLQIRPVPFVQGLLMGPLKYGAAAQVALCAAHVLGTPGSLPIMSA
jgi:hypothetical protein